MATNMYIKFETPNVTSEAVSPAEHAGEIEIMSWSHGFSQPTSPVGAAPRAPARWSRPTHSNFTFTKYLDSATDDIFPTTRRSGKAVRRRRQ